MSDEHPALVASRESWRCVQAHDKQGWLGLMADDILIEDPIGASVTNPDGAGARGKAEVAAFYDSNIAQNTLSVTCEATFLASSPHEVAHVLSLRSEFDHRVAATVRGIFTYRVDDDGKLTSMRGYWTMDDVVFGQPERPAQGRRVSRSVGALAGGAGAALALVHRLDPGDGDGAAFVDQLAAQGL
jgi:steroid delta-isomerase